MYQQEHFSKDKSIEVRVFYMGIKIENQSLGKNETINSLYPSAEIFDKQYQALQKITIPGRISLLEISEKGILHFPNIM